MKDAISGFGVFSALAAAVLSADAAGPVTDLQGFNSCMLAVNTGAVTGAGDFSIKLQHSDTDVPADFTDVPADDILGSLPETLDGDAAYKLGYKGGKRYIRAIATHNGGTSLAMSALFILGHPYDAPVP